MKFSFMPGMKMEEDGDVVFSVARSKEEMDLFFRRMTDPTFESAPQPDDPPTYYPAFCRKDAEKQRKYNLAVIEAKLPLPPLRLLPEDSVLRAEWFRRAEIIKKELEQRDRELKEKNENGS